MSSSMPDPASYPSSSWPTALAELAADPQAEHWARECGWVPGTGHCRKRACSGECLFRPQRHAEMASIIRRRRKRRAGQQTSPSRADRR